MLSNHLRKVSKQAVEEQGKKEEEYRVDGEVERFTSETYRVKGKDGYDSGELFPALKEPALSVAEWGRNGIGRRG